MYDADKLSQIIIAGVEQNKPLHDLFASLDGVDKRDFYRIVLTLIQRGQIPNLLMCYCGIDCGKQLQPNHRNLWRKRAGRRFKKGRTD